MGYLYYGTESTCFYVLHSKGPAPGVLDFDFHIVYEAFPLDRHMGNTQAHTTSLFISSSEDSVPDCSQRRNFVRRCLSKGFYCCEETPLTQQLL